MIKERTMPDAGKPAIPAKLVSFPVTPPTTRKPQFKRHWLIAGLLSLLVVAAVAVTLWALGQRSSIGFVTAPVTKGAVIRTVTATGTVNPELTIIVGAAVSGVIQQLTAAIAGPLFYRRWFSRQELDDAFVRGVVERALGWDSSGHG